jgi:hypothetical protein
MAVYDLYVSPSSDIDAIRGRLEVALGIELEARESGYHGECFQWGSTSGEHLVLKVNKDPLDGEPAESSFPDHMILFYLNDTSRAAELREVIERVEGFVLLRHEDLE